MIYVAICDDEAEQVELLSKYVKDYFKRKKIEYKLKTTRVGNELLEDAKQFDIIFLDIEIGEQNGIKIAKKIREVNKKCKLIYVTLHDKYVFIALDTYFFTYLSKPIEYEEICEKLDTAINYMIEEQQKIQVEVNRNKQLIEIDDIIYIKKESRNVNIYTSDKSTMYKLNYSLKEIEEKLKHMKKFTWIHRTCLINFDQIKSIDASTITMKNNDVLSIAQRRKREFEKEVESYFDLHVERREKKWIVHL